MESTLWTKGRTTIPKPIREHLKLRLGGRLKYFLHPDGQVVLLSKLPAKALRPAARRRRVSPVSLEAMDEAIAEGAKGGCPRPRIGRMLSPCR